MFQAKGILLGVHKDCKTCLKADTEDTNQLEIKLVERDCGVPLVFIIEHLLLTRHQDPE